MPKRYFPLIPLDRATKERIRAIKSTLVYHLFWGYDYRGSYSQPSHFKRRRISEEDSDSDEPSESSGGAEALVVEVDLLVKM